MVTRLQRCRRCEPPVASRLGLPIPGQDVRLKSRYQCCGFPHVIRAPSHVEVRHEEEAESEFNGGAMPLG